MASVKVRVNVKELQGAVLTIGKRAKNFDHSLITMLLLEHVEDNFDSEGAKGDGGKWQPLSASTIKRHPRRSSGQLLFDTSLLSKWQSRTMKRGGTSIVWSPASYATFHTTGTKFMPKRNPFEINLKSFMAEAERLISLEIGQ